MFPQQNNTAEIKDGNGNIIAQGILGPLTINCPKDIKEALNGLLNPSFCIIAITTTLDNAVQLLPEVDRQTLESFYGPRLTDWKPFQKETISKVLKEIEDQKAAQLNLHAMVMECNHKIEDEQFWAMMKYIRRKAIVIVDPISLHKHDQRMTNIFDDFFIGGCLVTLPDVESLNNKIAQNRKKAFKHLEIYRKDRRIHEKEHLELYIREDEFDQRIYQVLNSATRNRSVNLPRNLGSDIEGLSTSYI